MKAVRIATSTRIPESTKCAGIRLRGFEGGGGIGGVSGSPRRVHRNPSPRGEVHMQRMTGIDPMFIYSDTPETPMEIAYVCVFDPSSLPGGYSFERVTGVLQTRIPTAAAVPAPAHGRPARTGSSALGRRSRLRPGQPSPPRRTPGAGGRRRIPGQGGPGDGASAHAGAAAVGDARRRGHGRRHDRAHRQDPPLRHRRRRRRRDAGQASRPDRGGQRGDRARPALAAAPAALADPS